LKNEKVQEKTNMNWDKTADLKFNELIAKIPIFLREMARKKVSLSAEKIAQEAGHPEVMEKDMVDAFFAETPFGFHGPMKSDMDTIGVDYKKYGY
jgi:hypothetical protein